MFLLCLTQAQPGNVRGAIPATIAARSEAEIVGKREPAWIVGVNSQWNITKWLEEIDEPPFSVALNHAWYDISMSRGYVVSCCEGRFFQ